MMKGLEALVSKNECYFWIGVCIYLTFTCGISPDFCIQENASYFTEGILKWDVMWK